MSDKTFVIAGIHYGEHGMVPEEVLEEIRRYGDGCSLIMLRPGTSIRKTGRLVNAEEYYQWARFFKKHHIYFSFLYTQSYAPDGMNSLLTKEIVTKLYEIAGDYFLGDSLGEVGNSYVMANRKEQFCPKGSFSNMQEAKDSFVNVLKSLVKTDRELGIRTVSNVESHTMMKYSMEAGLDICCAELFLGNVDHILAFVRGASRGYGKDEFGGYIAHEWYAGVRHEDPLKLKRLSLIYRAAYMAGASQILLESGFEKITAYGFNYREEHPLCRYAREQIQAFNKYIERDQRPSEGPLVKVAFVSGYLDSYAGNSRASGGVRPSVWGQHEKEEWGYSAPEHSFRILDQVYRTCDWFDPLNFGDADYSNAPAYGQYDVLPIESPVSVMQKYDWLIFTGWNTMTEENYEKLKQYVENGGKLLVSAAHLKTGMVRGEDSPYLYNGKLSELLGCELTGEKIRSNYGYKFVYESVVEGLYYPGTRTYICDPIGSAGYTDYVKVNETTGRRAAVLARSFRAGEFESYPPVLIENSYGKGQVLFMCTDKYPGAPGVYTLYEILVKSILSATHRECDIRVLANDKVRFAVYKGDGRYKVYLLNTDMNVEQKVRVYYQDEVVEKMISSTELDVVEFAIKKND